MSDPLTFSELDGEAPHQPLSFPELDRDPRILHRASRSGYDPDVGGRAWWQIKAGSKRDVLRCAPVSLLFAASLYTFTAALHYSTLGAVITWRNLAPLPTMLVECCCFSHARLGRGRELALGQGLGLGSGSGLGLGLG